MTTAKKENIIALPHTNLRKRSQKIGVVTDDIKKIIDNMKSATIDWEKSRKHEVGVALAAVQINKMYRIVIVRNNPDDKKDLTFSVFINPEITKYEGTKALDFEGCLSIANIYGKVPRYSKVRVKAIDVNSKVVRIKADGFLARVMQHEIDHLNGKLFIDHIKNNPLAFYQLEQDGELKELDYDKAIRSNSILW